MVIAAATSHGTPRRPVAHACMRLANSASLLLPVSNLTNLLAMPDLGIDFQEFAVLMAPIWLAALVGLNVGSGLTCPGSLANLLWRRSMTRHGQRPSVLDFHRLAALVTPPAVVAAVLVLWVWAPAVGRS